MKRFLLILSSTILVLGCQKEVYHNITVSVNPAEGGTVSPSSGPVLDGTSVSFKATPKGDYIFTGWSGSISGTENPKTVAVTQDMNVTANFTLRSYPLTITVEGAGTVAEKVISTKSEYQSGTVVELTASPSDGWSFDHWGGDLSGNDNPAQITVSSEKTVKAVFVKNNYSFNVKIVGPGAVDEYLVEQTKATMEYGKQVKLVAIPSDGAIFKGWSGDASGNDREIIVQIDKDSDITASFEVPVHTYPLPNLNQPSVMLKRFYPDRFTNKITTYAGNMLTLDYNQDGYPDLITSFTNDEIKAPIRFYLGTSDGALIPDPINDRKIIGLDECRKIIYGEYNGDGIADICIISHGFDFPPFPGDYPLILLSKPDGTYFDVRFPEFVGFYHGGCAGDFDNDGDSDIFFSDSFNKNSVFLINDGLGNFTATQKIVPNTESTVTTELFDINKDGYLDLVLSRPARVIWGNGETFADNEISFLPKMRNGCEEILDFTFYDVDADGNEEVIVSATDINYEIMWEIQILDYVNDDFIDVTENYFDNNENFHTNDGTLIWTNVETEGDKTFLVGRLDTSEKQTIRLFEFEEGKFVCCIPDEEEARHQKNGLCYYCDGQGERLTYLDPDYSEDYYLGNSCIKFSNWPIWQGWSVNYGKFMDFSILEKNGYCLEFAIKNSDPDLFIAFSFETRLQTEPWYFPSYGYNYDAHEHKCDGTWELVQVPLNALKCDDEWTGYYWNTIKTINIMPGECHGKDFYLDEIRIRKILPN